MNFRLRVCHSTATWRMDIPNLPDHAGRHQGAKGGKWLATDRTYFCLYALEFKLQEVRHFVARFCKLNSMSPRLKYPKHLLRKRPASLPHLRNIGQHNSCPSVAGVEYTGSGDAT